jgi:hypothetical protein
LVLTPWFSRAIYVGVVTKEEHMNDSWKWILTLIDFAALVLVILWAVSL